MEQPAQEQAQTGHAQEHRPLAGQQPGIDLGGEDLADHIAHSGQRGHVGAAVAHQQQQLPEHHSQHHSQEEIQGELSQTALENDHHQAPRFLFGTGTVVGLVSAACFGEARTPLLW